MDKADLSLKVTIKGLKTAVKNENDDWEIILSSNKGGIISSMKRTFSIVWIQATIEQVTLEDICLVNDSTSKAKIVKCKTAIGPQDRSWMSGPDVYCNIIGTLVRAKGLPEIEAQQLIPLGNKENANLLKSLWPLEVEDAHLYLLNIIQPDLYLKNTTE